MATNYFGDSFYEESLIVRCACKEHLAEFYIYQTPERKFQYGIEWLSCYNYKKFNCNHIGVMFEDFTHFNEFVINLIKLGSKSCFTYPSWTTTSTGEFCENGIIVVEDDGNGWVDFSRYLPNRKKPVWDFCIEKVDWQEFISKLSLLVAKGSNLEIQYK